MSKFKKEFFFCFSVFFATTVLLISCKERENEKLHITALEYRNKMKGAWIGQMAGVGWGMPTEFKWNDTIIPVDQVPEWTPEMVNQQGNDDLYVEMTFLASMEKYGMDVSIRQAGIDFANTGYQLWAANRRGRENLRYGIAPPESSHPEYNKNADDIDYQIEADFAGIIAPGMPNVAIALGEKFGRLMNYGDGLYGGQFVSGMYTAAYFENDVHKVIEAGLACIPRESLYTQCIRDVVQWYKENPNDFEKTWGLIMNKYYRTFDHQPFASKHKEVWIPIDAKINGAFIVMGLLYGEGDMEKTIVYSMRCGLDSDCNPSNAAGILGTIMGYDAIPDKFKSGLDSDRKFSYSNYPFTELLYISERFTRELIAQNGGSIDTDKTGEEIFAIIRQKPTPSFFSPSYNPSTFNANNKYTEVELKDIEYWSEKHFEEITDPLGLNINVLHCGKAVDPGLTKWNNQTNVLRTIPANGERSVVLEIKANRDATWDGKKAYLSFKAGHDEGKTWMLSINSGENEIETLISEKNSLRGWKQIEFPLLDQERLTVTLQAKQTDKDAVNYWSDFSLIYK